jgi:hypothetical protein
MKKNDTFYGADNEEYLSQTTLDDAIEMAIDSLTMPIPKTIEIYKYKRSKPKLSSRFDRENVLMLILDSLDEEFGNPDDPYSESTDEMIKATDEFINKIESLYVSWTCEKVGSTIINCKEWVKTNAPHWVTEKAMVFQEDIKGEK